MRLDTITISISTHLFMCGICQPWACSDDLWWWAYTSLGSPFNYSSTLRYCIKRSALQIATCIFICAVQMNDLLLAMWCWFRRCNSYYRSNLTTFIVNYIHIFCLTQEINTAIHMQYYTNCLITSFIAILDMIC